jgi:hypothetical protein
MKVLETSVRSAHRRVLLEIGMGDFTRLVWAVNEYLNYIRQDENFSQERRSYARFRDAYKEAEEMFEKINGLENFGEH